MFTVPSEIVGSQFPQVNAQMGNPKAPQTIYISTDPRDNDVTLLLAPNQDAALKAARPCPPDKAAKADGTLFYVDLSDMGLTADEFAALDVSAGGWQCALCDDVQTVCLAPKSDMTMQSGAGNGQPFAVAKLTLANAPSTGSANLTLSYYRIAGFTTGDLPEVVSFKVLFQQPPDKHDKNLQDVVALDLSRKFVVTSLGSTGVVANRLGLTFGPGQSQTPVPAGRDTRFVVSFVYAKDQYGYGALATVAEAVDFKLTAGVNAGNWKITPGKDQQNPSWLLQPPEEHPIIGTGTQAVVGFDFAKIVTEFRPGPTLMFVSYSGVPGYKDGAFVKFLSKVPHVAVKSFTAEPAHSTLVDGKATVTLKWQVENAGTVTITDILGDLEGKTSTDVVIRDTREFTLTAQGTEGANIGNVAVANVTAYVDPVINSFEIVPQSIEAADFPSNVRLSWNVNTNKNVRLSSSVTGRDPSLYNPLGSIEKSVNGPQMFTLTPEGAAGPWIDRLAQVSSFVPQVSQLSLPATGKSVAMPANAGFVAVTLSGAKQVAFVSSVTNRLIGSPVGVGSDPQGLAFTPDGGTLFVANGEDGTVSVIAIKATQSSPPYSFNVVKTVTIGGTPRQVAVSPDGKSVYVTVWQGDGKGLLAVLAADGDYAVQTTVKVGRRPEGVAVSRSGGQVFVANSLDKSISMLAVAGGKIVVTNTLTDLTGAPQLMAVTVDGRQLLVTMQGKDAVVGFSIDDPGQSLQTTYAAGPNPLGISVFPGGGYALVSNAGRNRATLLRVADNPGDSAPPGQTITLPAEATNLAVGAASSVAYVTTTGTALCMIAFARYQAGSQIACNAQVTDVALSPDGATAVVWSQREAAGLIAVHPKTKAVTPYLAHTKVIGFAYGPAGSGAAYLCVSGSDALAVLDASTFTQTTNVKMPAKEGATTRQPVAVRVMETGRQVFVLVSDGNLQYSVVVIAVQAGGYKITDDVVVFTASGGTRVYLAVAANGSKAFAVDSIDLQAWVVERGAGGSYAVHETPVTLSGVAVNAIAISPDGSTLYVVGQDDSNFLMTRVDTTNLEPDVVDLNESTTDLDLTGLAVSPDGKWLFAADQMMAGLHLIDARSLGFLQMIHWQSGVGGPAGVAVAPDGSVVYLANQSTRNLTMAVQTRK